MPRKKKFVSCNAPKKNWVGRSVKKICLVFFWSKMCTLCMFYVDLGLGGLERDFFE